MINITYTDIRRDPSTGEIVRSNAVPTTFRDRLVRMLVDRMFVMQKEWSVAIKRTADISHSELNKSRNGEDQTVVDVTIVVDVDGERKKVSTMWISTSDDPILIVHHFALFEADLVCMMDVALDGEASVVQTI